jgi:hypothetical protein
VLHLGKKSMKQILTFTLIILTIIPEGWAFTVKIKDDQPDSIRVIKIVNDFFDWYITSVKEQKYMEFRPVFAERADGMTTLDFSTYLENLKRLSFSDELLKEEKRQYNNCVKNLGNIKYSDFESEYVDLDQFEIILCDFTNHYRWTGGMDPVERFRIKNVKINKHKVAKVEVDFSFTNQNKTEQSFSKGRTVTLIRKKSDWKIKEIK